jgi:transposase
VDEVSYRKGHRYLTIVVCHDSGRIVWAAPGRSGAVLEAFFDLLGEERLARIEAVSLDMIGSWTEVVRARLPAAAICTDPFHVVKLAGDALDTLRRADWQRLRREDPGQATWLKGTRFVLRRRADDLTGGERSIIDQLAQTNQRVYHGWLLYDQLRAIYHADEPTQTAILLDQWCQAALGSGLEPFVKCATTLLKHATGIINAIRLGLTNARLEAMNSTVRLISHRSRGFKRIDSLIALIQLTCGRIPIHLPT